MTQSTVKFKLGKNGLAPYKKYSNDAGWDIFAADQIGINPKSSALILTDLFFEIPEGQVGLVRSRSGLSCRCQLEVGAGVIDATYRGEVVVHLYNFSNERFVVRKGDKIAQILFIPINTISLVQVEQLTQTERGSDGFGSTGL